MLAVAAVCLPHSGSAQEVVVNYEGSPAVGYASIAPTFHVALYGPDSIIVRPTVSYLYYETRDTSGTVKFRSPGASVELGYLYSTPTFTFDIGPALEVLWQETVPTAGPIARQTLFGVLAAGELSWQITPLTSFDLLANYDQNNRYFWSRTGLKERVTDRDFSGPMGLLLGAELTGQGNSNIQQYSAGPLVEIAFDSGHTSLQLRGGYSRIDYANHTSDSRPYFGAALYHQF